MELTEILNWVFGGTSITAIVTSIIFWSKSVTNKSQAMNTIDWTTIIQILIGTGGVTAIFLPH